MSDKFCKLNRFFVRGADCVLGENVCSALGFAKGTKGVMRGITWSSKDTPKIDLTKLPPGVVTKVPQPEYIIVEVNKTLIPIGLRNEQLKIKEKNVINFRENPCDLLFAVTYHKLQGLTLKKIILSIGKHPTPKLRISMPSLYVGASRVHDLSELRVLPLTDEDSKYLTTLKRDPLLKDWLNNYDSDQKWKPDGFVQMEKERSEKIKMNLALIDDLASLTKEEGIKFIRDLDLSVEPGLKTANFATVLKQSWHEGRSILEAENGKKLAMFRMQVLTNLKKLGNIRSVRLKILRAVARRMGIYGTPKMSRKKIIIAIDNAAKPYLSNSNMFSSITSFSKIKKKQKKEVSISEKTVNTFFQQKSSYPKDYEQTSIHVSDVAHLKTCWNPGEGNCFNEQPNIKSIISIHNWTYAKLENPGLNLCFINSAIQLILSVKPLSDLLFYGYCKRYCKNDTFLSEDEKIEILNDPNKSITPEKQAMTCFLIEFETLAINMFKNPNKTFSSSKVTKRFEEIEPDFIYGDQWDCSSVVDTFLTLYETFLKNENFDGKNNAQEVMDSLKVTMRISTQCNKCKNSEIREQKEYFLFVPLQNNVENIFKPFYNDYEFHCEICNDLAGNPQPRLNTGAVQKAQVKNIGQYLLVKFGRVVYNGEKVTYKVTIPEYTSFFDQNLKLEAWVEHEGQTINSGHYVTIRREGETCIRMSDDKFIISRNNSILKSELCYIALLKTF